MDRATLPRLINEGYITRHALDLYRNVFAMRVDVLDNGVTSSYDIEFAKIAHFEMDSESRHDKERIELTELWIDAGPSASPAERWSVTISIWDLTHVRLRCGLIKVDGQALD